MGYTTDFDGALNIEPPLSAEEVAYINKFSDSRRINRKAGPYFVAGTGAFGQGNDDDIIDHNRPDPSQPGLYCQWVASEDGTIIEWDGCEKFYEADAWMEYILEHFIGTNPKAQSELPFLTGHTCNGEIYAAGEESDDRWMMKIENNVMARLEGTVTYDVDYK